jgi:Flp pilus assembly pilin Flp
MTRHAIVSTARRFFRDETAGTAIEYSLVAAGIGAAIAGTVVLVGTNVGNLWTTIKNAFH